MTKPRAGAAANWQKIPKEGLVFEELGVFVAHDVPTWKDDDEDMDLIGRWTAARLNLITYVHESQWLARTNQGHRERKAEIARLLAKLRLIELDLVDVGFFRARPGSR